MSAVSLISSPCWWRNETAAAAPAACTGTSSSLGDEFPFTLADIKKELGPPTESDEDVLDYRDKLNLRLSSLGHLEMQVMTNPAGTDLSTKFFKSKLFKDEEGKAAIELLKVKNGERKVGRFEMTAKESTIVNGMVIVKITPLRK